MSSVKVEAYARALFEIAQAEGTLDRVEDELFRVARAFESNEQLRATLTDNTIPIQIWLSYQLILKLNTIH